MSDVLVAPPGTGTLVLGKTLLDTFYDGARETPNPALLNAPIPGSGYVAWSSEAVAQAFEEVAFGLKARGFGPGDRAAFFLATDVPFFVADLGCLLAGLVDVPIYVTHGPEAVRYVLDHSEATVFFVQDADAFARLRDAVAGTGVRLVVVADGPLSEAAAGDPETVSLDTLRADGRPHRTPEAVAALQAAVAPSDVATILYTSGTTGQPKGVVLTHENVAGNALTSFSGMGGLRRGPGGEVVLSFLPPTHVFARALFYGGLRYGLSTYFCDPSEVATRLREVRPTLFMTVPRVLEKVYARILERGAELTGLKKRLFDWALAVASRFDVATTAPGHFTGRDAVADRLVFAKWREALGGRVRHIIVGGAALSAELTNVFSAAGVHVLQGYGLTETSPVITFNRPGRNRAGTVGEPLPGVEVKIAEDGEILTRGPHVMQGYFKNPEGTAEVLSADGWFATGDIGEVTAEGRLVITDRKKDLFKLSTGKYVMPQPVEHRLVASPLVEQAVVVGAGQKFAAALLFPEEAGVRRIAHEAGLPDDTPFAEMVDHPAVVAAIRHAVDEANAGIEEWSTVKHFAILGEPLSIENGLLTPTLKVRRGPVRRHFAPQIAQIYQGDALGAELAAALKAHQQQNAPTRA